MKIDESQDGLPDTASAGDGQNRREFFNGLGKWSMIVIAAVSFFRGSVTQTYASREGTGRQEWKPPETGFQRLAKKKHQQHVDVPTGHINFPHGDVPHVDQNIMRQQKGRPSGQPPTKIYE